jgi:hypothetical protein
MRYYDYDCEYDTPDYDQESEVGYCKECRKNVGTKKMDFGIGAYEYWGSKEVHTDIRSVCVSCESDVGPERELEEEGEYEDEE